ncbi:MAG TPA: diguanylate cyclase [Thermoanaerobaculia bacterium]|nr:diguanylate cyclase [Thermoanaerobaculia bacterium]
MLPSLVAMNPMTAIGLILVSISLLLSHERLEGIRSAWATLCAALVILIGSLRLGEIGLGWTTGIDQLLFTGRLGVDGTGLPNHIAPNTALNFILLGSALLLLDRKVWRGFSFAEVLLIISIFDSLLPIIGYLYGTKAFYGIGHFIPMALHTAIVFLVLGIGILFARPARGLMVVVLDPGVSGVMVRRLLPAGFVLPVLLGWLRLEGQRHQLYDHELGVAILVVSYIVAFSGLVWWSGMRLFRLDYRRLQAESQLREMALTDELTGLRNRRGFYFLAEQQLKLAINQRMGIVLWCLYADLDGLKQINDRLGHEVGSQAIAQTAAILKATFRDADITARLGGDEFAVLAVSNTLEGGKVLSQRLASNIAAFNALGEWPFTLSLSTGLIRVDSSRPMAVDDLLKEADGVMYENKRGKRVEPPLLS